MKDNKLGIGAVAVFVVLAILELIVNQLLLAGDYRATEQLWRPADQMKTWIFFLVYAFVAFFFTLIFSKGYEGKGLMEGIRYGFYVGMMMAVPKAYGTYAAVNIPYSLALQWFIYGLIEYIILGIVLAAIYGKQAMVSRVQTT